MMLVFNKRLARYNIYMSLLLLVTIYLLLVAAAALHVPDSRLSAGELMRRADRGNLPAQREYARMMARPELLSLQRVIVLMLIALFASWSAWTLGWWLGGMVTLVAILSYAWLARRRLARQLVAKWYRASEPILIQTVTTHRRLMRLIATADPGRDRVLASRADLADLLGRSQAADISPTLRRRLLHMLEFDEQLVRDVMTPLAQVRTVAADEILGPLVLDELHRTGHAQFPVYQGSPDRIVGVLHIQDLLSLRSHATARASDVMMHEVEVVASDDTLEHALHQSLASRQHLLLVGDNEQTHGIITLGDILASMLGEDNSAAG